ncbi:MAG TPA: SAM-dependent methyltransferase [Thermomicrobiaceae bacterium]|nr:SAM-dependent methyltransferase [Thermomicrobiaceae bacterium]
MEPSSRRAESNAELVAAIRAEIARQGPITFARFMELALYHPEHGYYRAAAARPGRGGDFLTAPEAHPIFGHALARQLDEMWRVLGQPTPFTLREYGAGAGTLALALLAGLRADDSPLLPQLRYQPVEINARRRAELAEKLAESGFDEQLAEPDQTPFTGCVLANEFIDAFPVHRLLRHDGVLREVYVAWRDGWFAEELGPPSTPAIAAQLVEEGIELAEGQRAEVNLGAGDWVRAVAGVLERGYALVIDYGYPAAELYGPSRRDGTLKAYTQHQVHEDPYRAIGEQDLTAHVDFTALERAARAAGLATLGLTTQSDFLAGAGIGELLVALQTEPGMTFEAYVAARAAVMRMIDPGAMGRFRVLLLGKDVPRATLCGFSDRL